MPEGKLVVPALSRSLRVQVDQENIDRAERRSSSHCMIADAIKEKVPNAHRVSVDLQTIRYTDALSGYRYIYLTPPAAQRALVGFDQGVPSEPFTITATRPAQVLDNRSAYEATKERLARQRGEAPAAKKIARQRLPKKATVKTPATGTNRGKAERPVVVGGKQPPSAALHNSGPGYRGQVRRFGLRTLAP